MARAILTSLDDVMRFNTLLAKRRRAKTLTTIDSGTYVITADGISQRTFHRLYKELRIGHAPAAQSPS